MSVKKRDSRFKGNGLRPAKPKPGELALLCEICGWSVVEDLGYLTVESSGRQPGGRWLIFHDKCALPGSRGDRRIHNMAMGVGAGPILVRSSRVATYPQLLTTLADLAGSGRGWFSETDWPRLLNKVVADTEWTNDPEGGQMTQRQMMQANSEVYTKIGMLNEREKAPAEPKVKKREEMLAEADRLEAQAEALLLKVGNNDD